MSDKISVTLKELLDLAILGIEMGKPEAALEILKDARKQVVDQGVTTTVAKDNPTPGGMKHG